MRTRSRARVNRPTPAAPLSPSEMRLVDMDADALGEVYQRVLVPFALKLTCRALRDAGPKETKTGAKNLVKSGIGALQWACGWAMR